MAKRRRKPLTKAEAGRKGGKATVRKYGAEHMRSIGKAGFQALRRKFGFMGGSGRGALRWLNRNGKLPVRGDYPQSLFEELWAQLAPKDDDQAEAESGGSRS